MSVLGKVLSNATSGLVDSVGKAVDRLITSDEEREKLKNELTETIADGVNKMANLQKEIITAEISGNWLQRSWRPLTMLSFAFIIIYKYFISQIFGLPQIDLPTDFWGLLKIGFGGYVAGRSLEKISDRVSRGMEAKGENKGK